MEDLQLSELPVHIECFDNFQFPGELSRLGHGMLQDGVESKKDYRHYNVKTVQGINDFATMKEVVFRRYRRLLDEQRGLPQLVIIDGGKGQLSAAMESITDLGLTGMLTVVGLAKNEEEIFFPGDTQSIKLPYNSDSLQLVRRIRDEVHRFGITFHRQKRSKGTFVNELEKINGIGKQTADLLLQQFRSVNKIRQLTEEELTGVVGVAKARLIRAHFAEQSGADGQCRSLNPGQSSRSHRKPSLPLRASARPFAQNAQNLTTIIRKKKGPEWKFSPVFKNPISYEKPV